MEQIKALTFKEKQNTLKILFEQYQRAKVKLYCLEISDYYPQIQYGVVKEGKSKYNSANMVSKLNARIDDKEELRKMIATFEYIISSLSSDSKRIIEAEFIDEPSSDWWREYYAKSTYYRLKTRAMEELLFYFHA